MFEHDSRKYNDWKSFLGRGDVKETLGTIGRTLQNEEFYPDVGNILRFMEVAPQNIKHVIVGMDPYPSYNEKLGCPQATGRSFEVSELYGKTWDYKVAQSSLRNILKAIHFNEMGHDDSLANIRSQIAAGEFCIAQPTAWFDGMEAQGVVFLNATLTVKPASPGSHRELWSGFRELLADYLVEQRPEAKWHLWGKDAQKEYGQLLPDSSQLCCCHPRLAQFVHENTLAMANDVCWLGYKAPNCV